MRPAAPRRQSLLRSQARYALLPAATPGLTLVRGLAPVPLGTYALRTNDAPTDDVQQAVFVRGQQAVFVREQRASE